MKDDFIETELAKYDLPSAKIAELKDKYLNAIVKDVDDKGNYEFCKAGHQEIKVLRVNIDKRRVELKRSSLEFGRAVDGEARRLSKEIEEIEQHLYIQRKVVEDEKERIRKEKEAAIRLEEEKKQREEQERLDAIRKEQEAKELEIKEAQEKIEAEKKAIEEEKLRIQRENERIEREKKEAEERRLQAIEEEKLRKEKEKQRAIELEKAKKEAAEAARKKAIEDVLRKEAEMKQKAEQEEREAKRLEALKPDLEKLRTLVDMIESFEFPEVKDDSAKMVLNNAKQNMLKIAREIMNWKPMTKEN